MAKVRIGINGFGRIGRSFVRCMAESKDSSLEVVLVNDLTDSKTLAHLLRHDSVHGKFPGTVTVDGDTIIAAGHKLKVTAVKDPAELPHKALLQSPRGCTQIPACIRSNALLCAYPLPLSCFGIIPDWD